MTEVKRNNWSRFCKKFNVSNQYRQTTVSVRRRNKNVIKISEHSPLMGITIAKRGRFIDGIDLFTAQHDPGRLAEPILSIKEPVRITLEKDDSGMDNRLSVESKDGSVASIVLLGEKDGRQYHTLVEKLAYSIGEHRGFAPGGDQEDWFEAERKIKETELQLIR